MITPMKKVYVVARDGDRDRLLTALRDLGVVHLAPVDPGQAVAEERTLASIDRLGRAIQVLAQQEPAEPPEEIDADQAAQEALRIQRESVERKARLGALARQLDEQAIWGDLRLEQIEALRRAAVDVRFYNVPAAQVHAVAAECVQVIQDMPGKRVLVAVVNRHGEPELPEGTHPVDLPQRDRPTIRAEAAKIDRALQRDSRRLAQLAHALPKMRSVLSQCRAEARYTIAERGGLAAGGLYSVQGWVPADRAATLGDELVRRGVPVATQDAQPAPQEQPPTLVHYPFWARPMKGLFQMLGTVPGYREFEISAAFMIAMPIFSAILISDAGYGLLYLLLPAIFYRKMAAKSGPELAQLVMVIGAASIAWGVATASFFGFDMSGVLAHLPVVGRWFADGPPVTVDTAKPNMDRLMWMSFILGAIHLSSAHLWRAARNFPHPRFLCNLGWAIFLWGMFGVVTMVVLKGPFGWGTPYPYFLVIGSGMAILFAEPSRNILKTIGLGLANYPLSAIGTFGDTVSYVRLMAVGLAGTALAVAFNGMGKSLPIYGTIPVLMLGHGLNVALTIVSLFAHGVRLNMLEFSNNLGMTWCGVPYEPFSSKRIEET